MEEITKSTRGRPTKELKDKADIIVKVCFTQSEYKDLVSRKLTTHATSLSDFIRSACFGKSILLRQERSSYDDKVLSFLREIKTDLLRVGININQSTKRINSTTDYFDLYQETQKLKEKVAEMERQVQDLITHLSRKEG